MTSLKQLLELSPAERKRLSDRIMDEHRERPAEWRVTTVSERKDADDHPSDSSEYARLLALLG